MNDRRHIAPGRFAVDLLVWVGLSALVALNLVLAYVPMGAGNVVAAMAIGTTQMLLIALFSMRLRNAPALLRLAAGAGFLFFAAMVGLTFADVLAR